MTTFTDGDLPEWVKAGQAYIDMHGEAIAVSWLVHLLEI
jgi:hypothetical protein